MKMKLTPGDYVIVKPAHCTPGLSPNMLLRVTAVYGSVVKIEYPAPTIKENHPDKIGQERPSRNLPLEQMINIKGVIPC